MQERQLDETQKQTTQVERQTVAVEETKTEIKETKEVQKGILETAKESLTVMRDFVKDKTGYAGGRREALDEDDEPTVRSMGGMDAQAVMIEGSADDHLSQIAVDVGAIRELLETGAAGGEGGKAAGAGGGRKGWLWRAITWPFRTVAKFVEGIPKMLGGLMSGLGKAVGAVGQAAGGLTKAVGWLAQGVGKLGYQVMDGIGRIVVGLADGVSQAVKGIGWVARGLGKGVGRLLGAMGKGLGNLVTGMGHLLLGEDGKGGLLRGIGKFIRWTFVGEDGKGGLFKAVKWVFTGKEGRGGLFGLVRRMFVGKDGKGGMWGMVKRVFVGKDGQGGLMRRMFFGKDGKGGLLRRVFTGKDGKGGLLGLAGRLVGRRFGRKRGKRVMDVRVVRAPTLEKLLRKGGRGGVAGEPKSVTAGSFRKKKAEQEREGRTSFFRRMSLKHSKSTSDNTAGILKHNKGWFGRLVMGFLSLGMALKKIGLKVASILGILALWKKFSSWIRGVPESERDTTPTDADADDKKDKKDKPTRRRGRLGRLWDWGGKVVKGALGLGAGAAAGVAVAKGAEAATAAQGADPAKPQTTAAQGAKAPTPATPGAKAPGMLSKAMPLAKTAGVTAVKLGARAVPVLGWGLTAADGYVDTKNVLAMTPEEASANRGRRTLGHAAKYALYGGLGGAAGGLAGVGTGALVGALGGTAIANADKIRDFGKTGAGKATGQAMMAGPLGGALRGVDMVRGWFGGGEEKTAAQAKKSDRKYWENWVDDFYAHRSDKFRDDLKAEVPPDIERRIARAEEHRDRKEQIAAQDPNQQRRRREEWARHEERMRAKGPDQEDIADILRDIADNTSAQLEKDDTVKIVVDGEERSAKDMAADSAEPRVEKESGGGGLVVMPMARPSAEPRYDARVARRHQQAQKVARQGGIPQGAFAA